MTISYKLLCRQQSWLRLIYIGVAKAAFTFAVLQTKTQATTEEKSSCNYLGSLGGTTTKRIDATCCHANQRAKVSRWPVFVGKVGICGQGWDRVSSVFQ
jgi:hypothetical protein